MPQLDTNQGYSPTLRLPRGIDAAGQTHPGLEHDRNEDQFLVAALRRGIGFGAPASSEPEGLGLGSGEGVLLAVADGIGGLEDGEVASSLAVHGLADDLWQQLPRSVEPNAVRQHAEVQSALGRAFRTAHDLIARTCTRGPMGSTLTAALVLWPDLYLAHAGDCRCYLLRGGELTLLTRDHTMAELTRERGGDVPPGARSEDALWNALGGPGWALHVDLSRHQLCAGDVLLLCSDGLIKHVGDGQLRSMLAGSEESRATCQRLLEAALDGGGWDNITTVVARAS